MFGALFVFVWFVVGRPFRVRKLSHGCRDGSRLVNPHRVLSPVILLVASESSLEDPWRQAAAGEINCLPNV